MGLPAFGVEVGLTVVWTGGNTAAAQGPGATACPLSPTVGAFGSGADFSCFGHMVHFRRPDRRLPFGSNLPASAFPLEKASPLCHI